MGQHRCVEYVAGRLTRERLRALLDRERVTPLAHNLEGSHGG